MNKHLDKGVTRRDFIKIGTLGAAVALAPTVAGDIPLGPPSQETPIVVPGTIQIADLFDRS